MSKRQFLIILGVWVMIFLFLGFPSAWDKIFALVTGLLMIIVAFRYKTPSANVSAEKMPFVEHRSSKMADIKASQAPISNQETAGAITSTDTSSS